MRIDDILDETIELIIANMNGGNFKDIGSLRKSEYQHSKGEDDAFLRSDMYKGIKGNSEAAKKGHITRKKNKNYKKDIEKAAKTRSEWYQNAENRAKFLKKIKERDKKKARKNSYSL